MIPGIMPLIARLRSSALAVAVVFAAVLSDIHAIGAAPVTAGAGGEETVLAVSSPEEGAIRLGAEPRYIRLGDDVLEKVLLRAQLAGSSQRVYLVFDEIRAKRQPGILYEVFLNATDGGPPTLDPAEIVGHLNLFERVQRQRSFDVTKSLEDLASKVRRGQKLIVSIRPMVETPSVGPEFRRDLEEAAVTIDRVRLVAQ